MELEELPLFPLNTVLFPYASLRLHVFEERYRQLVHDCLNRDRPFGVVLIRSGSEIGASDPYMVGTAVRIVQVDTYDDGRMDIQVQGERRFRIRQLDESKPYLVGFVEPVVDSSTDFLDDSQDVFDQAREEFEVLIQRLFARQEFSVQVVFPADPVALSFTIANLLQIENLDKQRMLETTDTLERVQDLLPILETQLGETAEPSYYRLASPNLREWITPN